MKGRLACPSAAARLSSRTTSDQFLVGNQFTAAQDHCCSASEGWKHSSVGLDKGWVFPDLHEVWHGQG